MPFKIAVHYPRFEVNKPNVRARPQITQIQKRLFPKYLETASQDAIASESDFEVS